MSTIMSFKPINTTGILSAPFDPALLDDAIIAYDNHAGKLLLPNGQTLKGLRFDREHIETILLNQNVKHLYLRFIVSPDDGYITVVAGGSVPTAAHPNGECDKNVLYDYCEPCPSVCAIFV
jgi:hypothetical protein